MLTIPWITIDIRVLMRKRWSRYRLSSRLVCPLCISMFIVALCAHSANNYHSGNKNSQFNSILSCLQFLQKILQPQKKSISAIFPPFRASSAIRKPSQKIALGWFSDPLIPSALLPPNVCVFQHSDKLCAASATGRAEEPNFTCHAF